MYAKRVQIINYGPIEQFDIEFPFEGDLPKPVVLVGENGTGKSILLSHVVNALIGIKDHVYPESPEVETGQAFKVRSTRYIKSNCEGYFGRVDFDEDLYFCELMVRSRKREYETMPAELLARDAKAAWKAMDSKESSCLLSSYSLEDRDRFEGKFDSNCVLYFPPNRFEEPAWLNEDNLNAQASYMGIENTSGKTVRRVANYSPLRDNLNWLFDLVYDWTAIDTLATQFRRPEEDGPAQAWKRREFLGDSMEIFGIVIQVFQEVLRDNKFVKLDIGRRQNRFLSIVGVEGQRIPNVFQLSSGETSLLNLFISILRDFDLCSIQFSKAEDVRGIVVVDEVDLHLHAIHQYEVLPRLIQMVPRVQFVMTTHSPLFVLGMNQLFGEDGFAVHRMPEGHQVSPEEFSEFASAYQAFTATSNFSDDVRSAIENSRKPVVFIEGTTDMKYLRKAAELLNLGQLLERIELKDGCGDELEKTWKAVKDVPDGLVPGKVVVIRDCDYKGPAATKGNKRRRTIPQQPDHPVERGIENLFSKETMAKARTYKPAFVDVTGKHKVEIRGHGQTIPEKWFINKEEKSNLCDWLCENGTAEDFKSFHVLFDLLREAMGLEQSESSNSSA